MSFTDTQRSQRAAGAGVMKRAVNLDVVLFKLPEETLNL
jgi:hypothetical protein